jgi:hypothetical protein
MTATAARSARAGVPPLVHGIAGTSAFVIILAFWTATVFSELFADFATVAAVKLTIAWGLLLLVPALAVTGLTGFRLAGGSAAPAIAAKTRRMPFIAANGVLVLVPCALTLAVLSGRGDFGTTFEAVQAVELIAGFVNLVLIAKNIGDGLALSGRRAVTP